MKICPWHIDSASLIAKKVVEIAKRKGHALAHGCTGKETTSWDLKSFSEHSLESGSHEDMNLTGMEMDYAKKHGTVAATRSNRERGWNIWAEASKRSWRTGFYSAERYLSGQSTEKHRCTDHRYRFENGVPVSLDGESLDGVSLIQKLNKIGVLTELANGHDRG